MTQDADFWDGFDTYGPEGFAVVSDGVENVASTLIGGKWTSLWAPGGALGAIDCVVGPSLIGPGHSLQISYGFAFGAGGISMTLPQSYGRITGSGVFSASQLAVGGQMGICFGDAGSDQFAITIESSGQLGFRRASSTVSAVLGDLVALSNESVAAGEGASIAFDVTPDLTDGVVKVWLNGLPTSLFLTGGQVTQNTANATINQVRLMMHTGGGAVLSNDHLNMRFYIAAGGTDPPAPLRPAVETDFAIADDVTAFTIAAAILGPDYSGVATTNAPGANQLFLRRYTPDADGTLESIGILPAVSSATAKFTMAAYADSAGAAGAVLSDGVEVIGCTADEPLFGDLVTPQALVAGAPIWVGAYGDTAIALRETDDGVLGRKVARTYGSGAPATAGVMTASLPSWVIFGLVSGVTETWSVVDLNPASALSYVSSATPGDRDMLIFPALETTPTTIYGLSVEIVVDLDAAGLRTVNLLTKSGATTDTGSSPGQSPAASRKTIVSRWRVDPDTLAAWNASGVNLAKHGYEIAS